LLDRFREGINPRINSLLIREQ